MTSEIYRSRIILPDVFHLRSRISDMTAPLITFRVSMEVKANQQRLYFRLSVCLLPLYSF